MYLGGFALRPILAFEPAKQDCRSGLFLLCSASLSCGDYGARDGGEISEFSQKRSGAYFTPDDVSAALVAWACRKPPTV